MVSGCALAAAPAARSEQPDALVSFAFDQLPEQLPNFVFDGGQRLAAQRRRAIDLAQRPAVPLLGGAQIALALRGRAAADTGCPG